MNIFFKICSVVKSKEGNSVVFLSLGKRNLGL